MFLFLLLYPSSYKRHLCGVSHLDALAFARAGAGRPQGRAKEMLRERGKLWRTQKVLEASACFN